MYPTIRDGEAITVAAVSTDEVVRGDVLLCRHDTRLLAHRVVGVTTRGADRFYGLRGDAKAACDAPVSAGDLVGKVISVCRNGRRVSLCGPLARLRYRVRAAASRAKAFVRSSAAIEPVKKPLTAETAEKKILEILGELCVLCGKTSHFFTRSLASRGDAVGGRS